MEQVGTMYCGCLLYTSTVQDTRQKAVHYLLSLDKRTEEDVYKRQNLNLIAYDNATGLELDWESGDTELIDSFGTVYNESLPPEGKQTTLILTVSDDRGSSQFRLPVTVFPPLLSDTDKKQKELLSLSLIHILPSC